MRPTAIGKYLGIVPCFKTGGMAGWYLVSFDKQGNWCSASPHATEKEASNARAKMRRYHKRLAEQRKARKR